MLRLTSGTLIIIVSILIFLFLLPFTSHALVISEVMYSPPYNNNYNEWIEIYNPGAAVNLTDWKLCDVSLLPGMVNSSDSKLYRNTTLLLPSGSYAIITDGGSGTQAYENFAISEDISSILHLHTDASSLCGGLSNSGEDVILSNGTHSDTFSYSSADGADSNNMTLCHYTETNTTIRECLATPGSANSVLAGLTLSVITDMTMNSQDYLFSLEIDTCESSSVTLSYNITGSDYFLENKTGKNMTCFASLAEWAPPAEGNYTVCGNVTTNITAQNLGTVCGSFFVSGCDLELSITSDDIVNAGESVTYYLNVNDTSCSLHSVTIEYWAEDLFGNDIFRRNTTQDISCYKSISRSWSPPVDSTKAYYLKARALNCAANASKLIVVKGTRTTESSLDVLSHDDNADFGDSVDVELSVYRGDTDKYAVQLWTEKDGTKSSYISTIHIKNRYADQVIRIPVQTKPNCDSSLQPGTHTIVVSGLGVNKTSAINLTGNTPLCKTITVSGSGSSSSTTTSTRKDIIIGISLDKTVLYPGEKINVTANITNNGSQNSFSVYSYAFSGSDLISEGGWTGNTQQIKINRDRSKIISLSNTIKDGVEPGLYSLRVRVKGDKNYDETLDITVLEGIKEDVTGEIKKGNQPDPIVDEKREDVPDDIVKTGEIPKNIVTGKVADQPERDETSSGYNVGNYFSPLFLFELILSFFS